MASFRIHEDQENIHAGELRRNNVKEVFQQKRSVLGAISTNNHYDANPRVNKQVLKVNRQDAENFQAKKYVGKPQAPVVPVAQFEAFSVYEEKADLKENKTQLDKKTNVPVAQFEAFKVYEEKVVVQEANTKDVDESLDVSITSVEDKDSPMSIDRSCLSNIENKPVVLKQHIQAQRDIIYDVKEYRDDIYKYMRECETKHRPKPGYMRKQPDITYSMRTVLVDWLVEVAEEYKLQGETLFLAVSYIDRFLSYMSVVRAKLQLVGTAAMFIAAKYEEIYPPDVGEFVYITDDTYSKKQVLRMEHLILKVLSFDLAVPTPLTFVKDFCTTYDFDDKVTNLSLYMIELSLLEADPYLQELPSQIACGAMALARFTLDQEPWTLEHEQSTGYSLEYLRPCIAHLYNTYSKATLLEQQAIQEKYKQEKYHHVALLLPKEPSPDFIDLSLYSTQPEIQDPAVTGGVASSDNS